MWTICASRLLMRASPSVAFILARLLATPGGSSGERPTMVCFGLICWAICIRQGFGRVFASTQTLIRFTGEASLRSLVTVSSYEALPSTRLSELWFEQHLFSDHVTIRVGQLTADTEFLLSSGGSNFLDATWTWATLPTFNLPASGPVYPLSTPGVRVAVKPNDTWTLMLGIYNGDPAGASCTSNPQVCDDDGLEFRLDSPPLLIGEASYKYDQTGQLPGTVKIGGWYQLGKLHEQVGSGVTVATAPNSLPIQTDSALYAIVDQLVSLL